MEIHARGPGAAGALRERGPLTAPDPPFFLPEGGDRFVATASTRGPWRPDYQHGGVALRVAPVLPEASVETDAPPPPETGTPFPFFFGNMPGYRTAMEGRLGRGTWGKGDVDPQRHSFVNVDLTVGLHRAPEGEWICLDATTAAEPHGIGLTRARLWDRRGLVGASLQSILLEARPSDR